MRNACRSTSYWFSSSCSATPTIKSSIPQCRFISVSSVGIRSQKVYQNTLTIASPIYNCRLPKICTCNDWFRVLASRREKIYQCKCANILFYYKAYKLLSSMNIYVILCRQELRIYLQYSQHSLKTFLILFSYNVVVELSLLISMLISMCRSGARLLCHMNSVTVYRVAQVPRKIMVV